MSVTTVDRSLRDQQGQWRDGNTRRTPASEGELLDPERRLGNLVMKQRQRLLGLFTIMQNVENGLPIPVIDILRTQDFRGVKIVGVASTLFGQEGLHAQGLWYSQDGDFDWYWVEITEVLAIEVREDNRFRGGAKCIWLTTAIGVYAMTSAHPSYSHHWDSALVFFDAPRVDAWPRQGSRPSWWPEESAGLWPGDKLPEEQSRIVNREEELRLLTEQLSIDPAPSLQSWRRLGHFGDTRFPGQPAHHFDQILPWELRFDGGIKVTRPAPGDAPEGLDEEEMDALPGGRGDKRKKPNHGGRRFRKRRQ